MKQLDVSELVQLARLPTFSLSLDGRLESFNEAAADLLGWSEECVGREASELFPEAHPLTEALRSASELEGTSRALPGLTSLRILGAEGCARSLLLKLVLQVEGDVPSVTAIGQDLTEAEFKAVEEKKTRLNLMVSQEVRTPLHGMVGLATAMEKTAPNAGAKKQLGMIRACASRLLDIVTNTMDLSQGEQQIASKVPPPAEKVNFAEVAGEVVTMSRMAVDKANKPLLKPGVEIKNQLSELEKIPLVLGQTSKFTQLLYNLVTNACKFTSCGSVSISAAHSVADDELEIRVTDTGCGIAADALPTLFRPFEQERSGAGGSQGLGLGLAACQAIAESHRGRIRVESEVGKGSSFIVTFPCTSDLGDKVQPVLLPELPEGAGSPAGASPAAAGRQKSPTLLSIDEDVREQEAVAKTFGGRYKVIECPTAEVALDWLRQQVPASTSAVHSAPVAAPVVAPVAAGPAEVPAEDDPHAEAELQLLKQELARYRAKHQHVVERLKVQICLDKSLQQQVRSLLPSLGDQLGDPERDTSADLG